MVTLLSSSSSRGHAPLFLFLHDHTQRAASQPRVRAVPSAWGLPSRLIQPPALPSPGLDSLREALSPVSGPDAPRPTQLHVLLEP